jgi:hypothetical protein
MILNKKNFLREMLNKERICCNKLNINNTIKQMIGEEKKMEVQLLTTE